MKSNTNIPLAFSVGLALFAQVAFAADTAGSAPSSSKKVITLKVGDPAPKLQNGKWVQGDPVREFDREHVYLVEFWATWCGPCKAAIPHLNGIHAKYKDRGLVVIGQNVWETSESLVEPFVKKMGDQMTYRVVLDDKSDGGKGRMSDTWLVPSGQGGIPASFLVDKQGRIAWVGHPMSLKETYLEQVLAGKHDIKPVAEAAAKAAARRESEAGIARQIKPHILKLTSQINAGQWSEAEESVRNIEKLSADLPEGDRAKLAFQRLRFLVAKGDIDAAVTYAETKMNVLSAGVQMQSNVARVLADAPGVKGAGLALATRLAEAGYAKGGETAKWFTTTLARIKFIQGDKENAIKLQAEALEASADSQPAYKNRLKADLESYQAGKLPAKT